VYNRYAVTNPGTPLSSPVRTVNASLDFEDWPVDNICRCTRMLMGFAAGLLQCLGKKNFGKCSSDVFDLGVAFLDSCVSADHRTDVYPFQVNNSVLVKVHGINPHNPLVLALFDSSGLRFIDQVLDLARVLAESTAASSPTVQNQIQSTYRLLTLIIPYLSDERVCAELLQPVSDYFINPMTKIF
jgi:hypothetical protein